MQRKFWKNHGGYGGNRRGYGGRPEDKKAELSQDLKKIIKLLTSMEANMATKDDLKAP